MKKEKNNKNINKEKGQSLLELAVSLVVLLILLAGVVDFGRIAFYYIALRDAAQEGASYGSIFPNDNYQIFERTKAGIVDQSAIEVITVRFLSSAGTQKYSCTWNYGDDPEDACFSSWDTCGEEDLTEPIIVGDVIEITISDQDFPITMPLLGTYLGRQDIVLETTIKDKIIRVPECE
jgi:hypothetical protein